jgi:hypothetical protein
MNNPSFLRSSIFSTCKNNLVCLIPSNPSASIPCKCVCQFQIDIYCIGSTHLQSLYRHLEFLASSSYFPIISHVTYYVSVVLPCKHSIESNHYDDVITIQPRQHHVTSVLPHDPYGDMWHFPTHPNLPQKYEIGMTCGSLWCFHVSIVWISPYLLVCQKFQMAITFAFGLCLRYRSHCWKYLVMFFDLVLFFLQLRRIQNPTT